MIEGLSAALRTCSGARWRDCPPEYGPYTTIYNRFNRWSQRGRWQPIFAHWSEPPGLRSHCRSIRPLSRRIARPAAEKGGADAGHRPLSRRAHHENPRPDRFAMPASRVSSHAGPSLRHHRRARSVGARPEHDRGHRRQSLRRRQLACRHHRSRGAAGDPQQVRPQEHPSLRWHPLPRSQRHRTDVLPTKDFRRIATRYDKLARNFLAAVLIAAIIAYWLN